MNTLIDTDNYLSLFFSLPHLQPMTVLSLFFLTLARILPIVAIAPFFGARTVPMTIRMMFSVALVAIFLPANMLAVHQEIPYGMLYIWLVMKELAIGVILGLIGAVPFFIAQMAGGLIDHQRGAAALQVTDPTTQAQTGSIGQLYNYIMLALFFSLDGPFIFLDGLASSYQLFLVDGIISLQFFNKQVPFWEQIFGLHQTMMNICIQLASPALIGILLTDMFLGIANRLAPQVQIVFLGISLKSWVGIALMTAAWGLTFQVMGKQSIDYIKAFYLLMEKLGAAYGKH